MVKFAVTICFAVLIAGIAVIGAGTPAYAEAGESANNVRLSERAARAYKVFPKVSRVAVPSAKRRHKARRKRVRTKDRPDRVVLMKGLRQMVLMRGDRVLKVYQVALGRYPEGAKREEGDAKTPEGLYTLDYRLDKSSFYRAIHVSYPNRQDIAAARARGVDPGGKIMIHGIANSWTAAELNHPKLDWTQGCIAVTNREIDEIISLIRVPTPIEIFP